MPATIVQRVEFDATPATLFETYVDARKHAKATGGGAVMSQKEGTRFSAWDGYIEGVNLAIVKDRLVVQSWRASDWTADDPDSILVLAFSATKKGARVDLVHANVPDRERDALDQGWHDNYWEPWKAYLAARRTRKAPRSKRKSTASG